MEPPELSRRRSTCRRRSPWSGIADSMRRSRDWFRRDHAFRNRLHVRVTACKRAVEIMFEDHLAALAHQQAVEARHLLPGFHGAVEAVTCAGNRGHRRQHPRTAMKVRKHGDYCYIGLACGPRHGVRWAQYLARTH